MTESHSEGEVPLIDKKTAEIELRRNAENSDFVFYKPEGSRSKVWEQFELLKFKGVQQNLTRCKDCKEMFKYNSKTGTGSLLRHTCSKSHLTKNKHLAGGASTSNVLSKFVVRTLPEGAKKKLIEKQLRFITEDLRPLSVTEGSGFQEFAQELISVGATFGNIDVKSALISRKTLTTTIMPQKYNTIKEKIMNCMSNNYVSFTTDMWTDKYTQKSYLTLTVHFITEDFNLQKYTLGTRDFTEIETGQNILETTKTILSEFNIEHKLQESFIVTDNGANEVCAFKSYKRISCACHNLNLVMHDVLDSKKCNIVELKTLIFECKQLVGFFKKSELNSKLSKTLKQHVDTRWNSAYVMLESVHEAFVEIQNLLLDRNALHRLSSINYPLLTELINFLRCFKECSEHLSSDLKPVIHEVALWSKKLLNHCDPIATDSDVMKEVKSEVKASLQRRFVATELHNVALFLNPLFKGLKILSPEKRENVHQAVKVMLTNIKEESPGVLENINMTDPPKNKDEKSRPMGLSIFKEFQDHDENTEENLGTNPMEIELETYKQKQCLNLSNDILSFWRESSHELPLMAKLARRLLCIPASSATSERVFSTCGRILEYRRSRLHPENVDKILFLHSNKVE